MTKVAELHRKVLDRVSQFMEGKLEGYVSWLPLDELIAAARTEGRAEGYTQGWDEAISLLASHDEEKP